MTRAPNELRPRAAINVIARIVDRWMPVARYRVEGPSMLPAFRAGERLVVNRLAYRRRRPASGDAIVLRDPDDRGRYLLKRVAPPPSEGDGAPTGVYVLGDNRAASRDSRAFGAVDAAQIVGRVWFRY